MSLVIHGIDTALRQHPSTLLCLVPVSLNGDLVGMGMALTIRKLSVTNITNHREKERAFYRTHVRVTTPLFDERRE